MNIYCIKIKYTKEAIKGMMEEGVDRAHAMRNLTEALGGKLLSFYGMVGQHYHAMAILEVPEYANLSAGIVRRTLDIRVSARKLIVGSRCCAVRSVTEFCKG